jgi:hypothetical protein
MEPCHGPCGGTAKEVVLAGILFVIIMGGLLLSPLCYELGTSLFRDSSREPLTGAELQLLESELKIKLPKSTTSVQTFVEHEIGYPAKLAVEVVSGSDDPPEFTSEFWAVYSSPAECPVEVTKWRMSGPQWCDPVPLSGDVVYYRPTETIALMRKQQHTTVYIWTRLADRPSELLTALKRYRWRDAPLVFGPPPATGVREWP